MASKTRKQSRASKPAAKGKVLPLHKRKTKEYHMNAGGFYDGMPGVVLDEYGNRKMIEFLVTPQGLSTSRVHAHPKLCKTAVQQAMSNPMIRGVIHSAVLDEVFNSKTPWNWILKLRLKLSLHLHHKRQLRKLKDAEAKMKAEIEKLEKDGKEETNTKEASKTSS